jgi:hypothetical protein
MHYVGTATAAYDGRAMETRATSPGGHFHAVRFYENAGALAGMVSAFVGEGLQMSQPAIVIATPDHRRLIAAQLIERRFDVERLQREGELFLLDADTILGELMIDGVPRPSLFNRTLVPLIEKACRGSKDRTVRAYGEMVDLLWQRGLTVAATRLEMLWNDLARTHDFSLLCGYSMGSFYKHADVEEIGRHHSHVVSDSGERVPAGRSLPIN